MKNFSKKISPFQIVIFIFTIFFSIILFLSIPALFDYERYKGKIKKLIYDEYKINLSNIGKINYSFLPSPHLKIENSTFSLNEDQDAISKIKDLEIYISLSPLYRDKKIKINNIKIHKSNFYLNNNNINQFRNHFLTKIHGPIEIYDSILFYLDKTEEVIAISKIRKIKYYIDLKSKEKKFKINGKIFDVPYNFSWIKNYKSPKHTISSLNFNKPKLEINNLNKNISSNEKKGNLNISYFRNNIFLKYKIIDKIITIESIDKKNNIKVDGDISLRPFYFDLSIFFTNINLDYIFDFIFVKIYQYKDSLHNNINGNLDIYFEDLDNKNFQSGKIKINIDKKNLKLLENNIKIKDIGKIYFEDIELKEINTQLYLISKIKINIQNQKKFYKKFNISKKNRINLKQINFVLERNIDENFYYISDIKINNKLNKNLKKYSVSNLQQLRRAIKKEFETIN